MEKINTAHVIQIKRTGSRSGSRDREKHESTGRTVQIPVVSSPKF